MATWRVRRGVAGAAAAALLVVPVGITSTASGAAAPPGTLLSTGSNAFGQLGVEGVSQRLQAGPVNGLDSVVQMHSGREHGVALTEDGRVLTWGSNRQGQLGLGGGGDRSQAEEVPGLSNVRAVSTGHYHTLAVDRDGDVWAWGSNSSGQLGDGTTSARSSPVRVSGLSGIAEVAAGRNMSYARTSGGLVYAWGLNGSGQLGDGTRTDRRTPVRVHGLTGITQIAGGRDHGLARDGDEGVWAWGWNRYGQLGDGTYTDRTTPRQVIAEGVAQVIAGAHHSYALRSDGTVASWGRGYRGALGSGGTATRTTPGNVIGVSDAVSIGSGRDHGLAVLSDGRVRTWGNNPGGQLGDGTTTRRTTAVWMTGVNDAVAASGGQGHSFVHVVDESTPPPPPQNAAPTADLDVSCVDLACTFDGSGSTDDDAVTHYAWSFGDGATASGPTPSHDYAQAGSYPVRLTVSDAEGLQDTASTQLEVRDAPPPPEPTGVDFRAAAQSNQNLTQPSVPVPETVRTGDTVLLIVSTNTDVSATLPAGWTPVATRADSELRSRVFSRIATSDTAGSRIRVTLGSQSKAALVVAAYEGVSEIESVASAIRTAGRATTMTTPAASLGANDAWVISYWVDKSSTSTGWSLPGGTRERATSVGGGGGRVVAALSDDGPVSGARSGLTATSTANAGKAVAWTLVLR